MPTWPPRPRCGCWPPATPTLYLKRLGKTRLARFIYRHSRGAWGDAHAEALLVKLDPDGIITSAPGLAQITGAQILGRLGDPNRFESLAGVRAFSGLVPSLTASG